MTWIAQPTDMIRQDPAYNKLGQRGIRPREVRKKTKDVEETDNDEEVGRIYSML